MKIAGICSFVLTGILLLIAGFYLGAYLIFEKLPHGTGRTRGKLCGKKYKKDVPVWGGGYKIPPRIVFVIKHLTKSKYIYTVNNKSYRCGFDFWKKPHEIPDTTWVIYLKAFPRISYLGHDENYVGAVVFLVKALTFFGIAMGAFFTGLECLSGI